MMMGMLHYSSGNPWLASLQAKWVTSPALPTDSSCSPDPHQRGSSSWILPVTPEPDPAGVCSIPVSAQALCAITGSVVLAKVTLLIENTD